MSPIQQDGAKELPGLTDHDDSGYDEFLKSFQDADAPKEPSEEVTEDDEPKKPSKETKEEPESDESPDDETTEETEEDADEDEKPKRKYAEDDDATYVKVKVGEEEHEVPVKDLKRLFGQEASLTQKSQKVSEEQKRVETDLARNVAASNALLERAKSRFEPYSKIDFLLASQQLAPEEYTALRNEAMKAYEDVKFLETGLNDHMQAIQTQQQSTLRERATATLKELSGDDPKLAISGWDEHAYNELRVYATTKFGVPQDVMNNLVDAWGLRVLHKAMLYDKGQNKANVQVTKVNKTPKKVVKTTTTPAASKSSHANSAEKAMQKLARSGSTDDAEAAFLARWNDDA